MYNFKHEVFPRTFENRQIHKTKQTFDCAILRRCDKPTIQKA